MKIIFLDFDGVLNALDDLGEENSFACILNPRLVALLNLLPEHVPEARFVLSTSWRRYGYEYNVNQQLLPAGFKGLMHDDWSTPWQEKEVIRRRPSPLSPLRGDEVHTWLLRNKFDPAWDRYVIFDDMDDFYEDQPLVKTSAQTGLTEQNVHEALGILSL